jgi:hypothetical protein
MTLNASGNLSIGNTNDTYKLDVNGTGNFSTARANYFDIPSGTGFNAFQMGADTFSGGWYVYDATNGSYRFKIANSGAATFSSSLSEVAGNFSGDVTIAKTTPGLILNGLGSGNSGAYVNFQGWAASNKNWQIGVANIGPAGLLFTPSTTAGGTTFSSPVFTLSDAGAATFSSTITGTTIYGSTAVCSPVGKFTTCLDLGGALTGTIALFNVNSTSTITLAGGGTDAAQIKTGPGDELYIGGNDTWQMRYSGGNILMDNGGCVGIGTAGPQSKLTIYEGDIRLYKQHVIDNSATWKASIY